MSSEVLTSTSQVAGTVPAPVGADQKRPLRVEHRGGDIFDINVRGHVMRVDQPTKDGGDDTAPTPTELFIASLASCVAFYARRYLARHNLPTRGLAVEAAFEMGSRPARVAGIEMRLIVPEGMPAERLDPLLAVATHCTVHNTLETAPEVSITLAAAAAAAVASEPGRAAPAQLALLQPCPDAATLDPATL